MRMNQVANMLVAACARWGLCVTADMTRVNGRDEIRVFDAAGDVDVTVSRSNDEFARWKLSGSTNGTCWVRYARSVVSLQYELRTRLDDTFEPGRALSCPPPRAIGGES